MPRTPKVTWAAVSEPPARFAKMASGLVRPLRSSGSSGKEDSDREGAPEAARKQGDSLGQPLLPKHLRHSEPPRPGIHAPIPGRSSGRSDDTHLDSVISSDEEEEEDDDQVMPMGSQPTDLTEPEEPVSSGERLRRMAPLFAVGGVVLLGVVFHGAVTKALDVFVQWVQALGFAAPWILGLVVAGLQLLMLPTFPLMAGAGVIFPKIFGYVEGQAVGVAAVFGGLWLGSMVTFIMGRRCFKEWAEEELKKVAWMTIVNNMIDEQGWWVVLLARMSPLLPAEVFNYACSLTSLSLCSFGIGCLGSIVPTAMWVCTAASAASAASAESSADALSPRERRREQVSKMLFIAFNLAFLFGLTGVLYGAFLKYKEKAEHHVEKHLMDVRRSSKKLSEEKVNRIRRELTKDLAFQRLNMRRRKIRRSASLPFARSLTWSPKRAASRSQGLV